jgi:predicted MFS family arabinose efflux permease
VAILFAGLAIPWLNSLTAHGWRLSWVVLGALVSLIALVCGLTLRNRPEELALAPMGGERHAGTIPQQRCRRHALSARLILHCGAIYFVFGFTFVAYATFIVTTMVRQYGFSQETAGSFWSWVGLLSLGSGPLFGLLADRVSRRFSLMLVLAIQTLAYLLAGLELSVVTLSLSIGCFGIVAWSIPSIMAALAGDYAGPEKAVAMFGALTFIFALGQVTGPVVAGLLAERTGGFAASYLLSAGMAALAAVLAMLLPNPADGAGAG